MTIYFNFFKVIEECWEYIRCYFSDNDNFRKIIITGGGAYKYEEELKKIGTETKKDVEIVQEFESLIGGLNFFKHHTQIEEFICS